MVKLNGYNVMLFTHFTELCSVSKYTFFTCTTGIPKCQVACCGQKCNITSYFHSVICRCKNLNFYSLMNI